LQKNIFINHILNWYQKNKRPLPWRQTKDPYLIWLSEIILQQTRVTQGLPYYNKFVQEFPTVYELAEATETEVLRLWQGLGYYSRARNLHKSAKIIVNQHQGRFPNTMDGLITLPGIGRYTSAAIASLASSEAVPAIDGNVYRLLARFFGIKVDISSAQAFTHFYKFSLNLITKDNPGEYNQAIIEFGALHCKPKRPDCENCVLNSGCVSYFNNWQNKLPVKKRKVKSRKRYFNYLIIMVGDKILMRQRTNKDIWQGLYDFVLIEATEPTSFNMLAHPILERIKNDIININADDKIIRHLLTHQILYVNFALIELEDNAKSLNRLAKDQYHWYKLSKIEELPKPVLIANYLDNYLNSINLQ